MDTSLKGKTAVVCGSTQGIGFAAAVELANLGADVVLMARDQTALQRCVSELPQPFGQAHGMLVADFDVVGVVRHRINDFVMDGGVCHILVNNTGGPPAGPALEADANEYHSAFHRHLVCNQQLVQALVPGMRNAQYGRIINVISTSVKQPIPGLGVSNTVRGAVASWAKSLANELGKDGITVNNVLPGFTTTARLDAIIATRAHTQNVTEDEVRANMRSTVPAARFATPQEISAAIAFLASPAASYINGINLPVDGGMVRCL